MKPLISVQNLFKSYDGHKVLKDLSIDIFEGETLVILGKSGVGKSVLLKQLIGLEKPDHGCIFIKDIPIHEALERCQYTEQLEMGMLFQSAALFDSLNIEQNTGFALTQKKNLKNTSFELIQQTINQSLHAVGLSNTNLKYPSELSGGMRKRAALARLIAQKPKIILYDEPTTGLDPITSYQISELIHQTQKKLRTTNIVVTHDLTCANIVADRIALHDEGKIVWVGAKHDFNSEKHPLISAFINACNLLGQRSI